jgi:hypothetical protein
MPVNPNTITGKIYLKIFELLEANPQGIQWTQLNKMIEGLSRISSEDDKRMRLAAHSKIS